ncbi:MAG: hypothetical protein KatS3mg105_5092 [Gemmatales bacterium]|nr:MAG: hypothetical protein KatS3mg105_5092 [Gemmatales bacterium]
MKNKEEPTANSQRGTTSGQVDLNRSGGDGPETTGALSRPGSTAAARAEQPALSLFPMSLMEAVVDQANMERAWKNVKANRGAPGPDGITIAEFPAWLRPRWPTIRQQLLDGTYQPGPVRRKTIDKPDGGQRLLGIPNVLERLIQQAIVQVLTPIFDPHFSQSSFGFRPKRSAHGAARQVQRIIRCGHRFAADIDLSKFFDRVQHDVLMARVARRVDDKRLLRLIGRYLRAGVMVEGVLQPTDVGTPQGGPLSPLLSNILLDDLDKELERCGLPFVRYADDFAIFAKSQRATERIMASVSRYLTEDTSTGGEPGEEPRGAEQGVRVSRLCVREVTGDDQRSGEIPPQVQATYPPDHRPQPGHLDGSSPERTAIVCSRLDGIFRPGVAIETVRSTRPVDASPNPDVLLETVASTQTST